MKNLVIAMLVSTAVLSATPAFAKTVTVVKPTSTAIVEQHANGAVDTITTTPTSVSIQNGMPFVPTTTVVTPTYHTIATPVAVAPSTTVVSTSEKLVNTVAADGTPTVSVVQPTVISTSTVTPVVSPVVSLPVAPAVVVAMP